MQPVKASTVPTGLQKEALLQDRHRAGYDRFPCDLSDHWDPLTQLSINVTQLTVDGRTVYSKESLCTDHIAIRPGPYSPLSILAKPIIVIDNVNRYIYRFISSKQAIQYQDYPHSLIIDCGNKF